MAEKKPVINSEFVIEIIKEDRVYRFCMPNGSKLGEAYDAAFEALRIISEASRESASQMARKSDTESAQKTSTDPVS